MDALSNQNIPERKIPLSGLGHVVSYVFYKCSQNMSNRTQKTRLMGGVFYAL